MDDIRTDGLYMCMSNDLFDNIDLLDNITIHNLPEDTISFELFLHADDVICLVVSTSFKDIQSILLTNGVDYYFSIDHIQRIELRREIKLD